MHIIPIFIPHLGCPNQCVFCNQRAIAAPEVPSAKQVQGEIEQGLAYTTMPEIAFYGGSFTAIGGSLMETYLKTAQAFVKDGRASGIRISTRPDAVDDGVFAVLKKYGVTTIELGVQSMEDKVLKAAQRGHTRADAVAGACGVLKWGFKLGLQLMVGLPQDTREYVLSSALALAQLRPDFVRIYPVCVIENTPLADMWTKGEYTPLSVEQGVALCGEIIPIFKSRGIDIIRIGLNPTKELSTGGVLAGAYHPSLGEMAYSRYFNNRLYQALVGHRGTAFVEINPRDTSIARGQKNAEYISLCRRLNGLEIKYVMNEEINRGDFKIDVAIKAKN